MNASSASATLPGSPTAAARPLLPLLVLLFIGSGCAALIYEVVWMQLLSLIVGSSAISMGVILGTFMGGMCLGSLFLSKYVGRAHNPLRVYAFLELGIAAFGVLIPFILPHVGGLYTAIGGTGMFGVMVRAIFCAIVILPPTLLMGATLPAISRYVESSPAGVSWLGFFYGGNIFGAVAGSQAREIGIGHADPVGFCKAHIGIRKLGVCEICIRENGSAKDGLRKYRTRKV